MSDAKWTCVVLTSEQANKMAIQQTINVSNTVQLGIRVSAEQRRQLRILAAERDTSVQALVEEAISALLAGSSQKGSGAVVEQVVQAPKPKAAKPRKPKAASGTGVSAEEFARGLGISVSNAQAVLERAARARQGAAAAPEPEASPTTESAPAAESEDEVVDLQADPFDL